MSPILNVLYILLAVLMFGFLIFIHELGHYVAARICGVGIIEFAVGMGPKIFTRVSKKTGIRYSVRLLPFGGFVNMVGEGTDEEPEKENYEPDPEEALESGITVIMPEKSDDDRAEVKKEEKEEKEKDPRSFANKPAWMRMIILFAGPFMNILLGFVLTFAMVLSVRTSDGRLWLASNTVYGFNDAAISSETGLKEGDTVVKVGNVPVHTGQELAYEIMIQGKASEPYDQTDKETGETVRRGAVTLDLTVVRDGETIRLTGVKFPAASEENTVFGNVDFNVYGDRPGVMNVIKHSWYRSWSSIKTVWDSVIGMITGRFSISSVSGPVGTTEVITTAAKSGIYSLLYIFALIAMNLGVFNLFPFLPLDGGHVAFALFELIFRKPVPKKVEQVCQTVGVMFMFALMIAVTLKDIVKLFVK